VRNFAWILILRNGGILDQTLLSLGLISQSLDILYSPLATGIGLTYSFLPFMILPSYVALERIDKRLIEAAFDLGANQYQVLKRVILPLALPGISAGSVLVFIPCLGAYVSPELLGGGKIVDDRQSCAGSVRCFPQLAVWSSSGDGLGTDAAFFHDRPQISATPQ